MSAPSAPPRRTRRSHWREVSFASLDFETRVSMSDSVHQLVVQEVLSSVALRVPVVNPHEALDDALVTAQLFLVLATKLEARGSVRTSSFLKLTRV